MSGIIRSRKAVTTAKSSPHPARSGVATAPAQMDTLSVDPGVSYTPASSASSVTQPVSAKRRHPPPSMTDTISTLATGASRSQPAKKNYPVSSKVLVAFGLNLLCIHLFWLLG